MSKKRKRNLINQSSYLVENASLTHIELLGNSEAIVDGCSAVLEYTSEKIRLDIGNKTVCFVGLNLSMNDFNLNETDIKGDIMSIQFSD